MEQISLEFSKIPIEIAIELAFQMGEAWQDLYQKADLSNAINFNDFQYAAGFGAQFKAKGTMENLPEVLGIKTDKDKEIIATMNKIMEHKRNLINLCKS